MSDTAGTPLELIVWMYHYIRDPGDAAEAGSRIAGLPVARFAEQLDDMAGSRVLGWPELRACLAGGQALPPDATLLTFDDGVSDHYLNAYPLLKERGLTGLFFIIARPPEAGLVVPHKMQYLLPVLGQDRLRAEVFDRLSPEWQDRFAQVEQRYQASYGAATPEGALKVLRSVLHRELAAAAEPVLSGLIAEHIGDETALARAHYLQPAQIREMAAGGMYFGGHTANHPWLGHLSAADQAREIAASAAWLSGIQPGPWAFAYPYGGLSPEAPPLLAGHNFAAAFTVEKRLQHYDPYLIGRLDGEDWVPVKVE